MEIAGKKVLLTGATGGIGRTIAGTLAAAGANLILSARSAEALEELAGSLPGSGHSVIVSDLGTPGAAGKLAASAGEVDVLVANAALPSTGRVTDLTDEQVARMLRINLESPILLAQALLPGMLERGRGKLVMIGSLAGKAGSPRSSIYNATKFGLRGFAFGLAADLNDTPVSLTLVAPGFVREAGMFADSGADAPPGLGTTTPGKVADAVLRAVDSDRIEITVAPLIQRTMAHVGLMSPHISHRVQSGPAGQNAADSLASGQTEKR
ncbi:MAG: SDR family NAD(P)-dependent oxidoreductase [Solirubrobacterales bacterium]|nr:SDR family NAD(P)-dependent oxidoreductase [Solirubrobacterales bacterium]MCB0861408.1 SDR family NAD(P)-dependent oxidoreductase [Solirubrobacterales bacterium]HRV59821.1 SDR family NAD(P)-dependent oxidoreductase [Solirubrobacterales bacterium]